MPTNDISGANEIVSVKKSKWRYAFIAIGIIQIFAVGLFVAIMNSLIVGAQNGASGLEFIVPVILAGLLPTVGTIVLVNLMAQITYIAQWRPVGKKLVFPIFTLLVSCGFFIYTSYALGRLGFFG